MKKTDDKKMKVKGNLSGFLFLHMSSKLENNRSMKKRLYIFYPNLLLAIITLLGLFFGIFYVRNRIFDLDFLAAFIMVGMAWFAVLADKLLRLRLSSLLLCCYYLLLLFSLFLGRMLAFYERFPWYGRFVYFLGGVFSTLLGLFIIVRLDDIGFLKFPVVLTYSLFFAAFAITFWELASGVVSEVFGLKKEGLSENIGTGISGAVFSSILLIIDHLMYRNKYLEKLIRKL